MAKQHRSKKVSQAVSSQGRGHSFEESESFDDSLLPDSEELVRLKEIDPNIIEWIKDRTAKEQDGRLDFNSRKMSLIEGSTKKAFAVDLVTILAAFIIILISMLFSYLLIREGQVVTGTIFAGATILFSANAFLNFRKNHKSKAEDKD